MESKIRVIFPIALLRMLNAVCNPSQSQTFNKASNFLSFPNHLTWQLIVCYFTNGSLRTQQNDIWHQLTLSTAIRTPKA